MFDSIERQLPDIEGKTEEENNKEESLRNSDNAVTFHMTRGKYRKTGKK